ncbi:serine/threonine-protein kinase [Streptomyces sp. NPDC051913]|uniref:serine/threonine-protein kinase n=1 Tax=Streptomyces sp. NPDC051913 TaxID=3365676 RepID=UPI0037CEC42C
MNDASEAFQPLQGDDPLQVAGYRLAARLGAGGMGRVYLSHTQGGRPVAIKVVRPELADNPDFRRRFRREINAAQQVRGAYTAELLDADADGTPPWLATLYVPGPSLAEAVHRRGPLPVPAVLWLMAGVAEALQAIHGVGIVHRDLKPSNVLLAADGPRVIDFGISLAADLTAHTTTGAAIGTPQFMAPEQALATEITAATDIFALGQTAAFAALGTPLYGNGPSATVLYRIVHAAPDLSGLPEPIRPLIARCLAADPKDRITAAEVVEWCRQRLGRDADAGGGPAVWREITGPEVPAPAPVPDPTALQAPVADATVAQAPSPAPGPAAAAEGDAGADAASAPAPHSAWAQLSAPEPTLVSASGPASAPAAGSLAQRQPLIAPVRPSTPTAPDQGRARRRRTALIAAAVVTASALLVTGLVWRAKSGDAEARDGGTSTSSTPEPTGSRRSSASSSTAADGSADVADAAVGDGAGDAAGAEASADQQPQAIPGFSPMNLDEKNSLYLHSGERPEIRDDRKGDIRFTCKEIGCALESDKSSIVQMFGDPGNTYEDCKFMLSGAKGKEFHNFSLAASAAGSEFCIQHPSGDIALMVIQVKSTALWDKPGLSFVQVDTTVWRKA